MRASAFFSSIAVLCACAESGSKEQSTTGPAAPPVQEKATTGAALAPAEDAPRAEKAVARTRIETIQFPAEDGLLVTADLYLWHEDDAPFVVLFHQAGWSRGEYKEIAPRLGELGFNCMAVDQRSGKAVNGVENQTARLAASKNLSTDFPDALPDMRASLRLVKTRYPEAERVAWGSSYSAALVLVLAGEEPELVDAVLAFSPGEYFARFGKSKSYVADAAKKIQQPTFITSAKKEAAQWAAIYAAIPAPAKTRFVPETAGNHGSRALWAKHKDAEAYWTAVEDFLKKL